MLYDGLLLIALWMIATAIIIIPMGGEIEAGSLLYQLYLLLVAWIYLGFCWLHGGQTLGMKAWRIRLVSDHRPVTWMTTLVRFVVAIASLLCFGIGLFWSLFHPRRATWHDLASRTWLVVDPKTPT
ncbi:RDD family protein [Wenzhouxiangella sp. AB-CW3]|nr:RDD family protein [Wenzhouxiangella sp. AB-CW3]